MYRRSLAVVAVCLWSTAALAGTGSIIAANNQVGGEFLMRRVNYTETANGVTLDTEKGTVPGAGLFGSLMYGPHNAYLAMDLEEFKGTTNYVGQYQSGGGYGSVVLKSGAKIEDVAVRDGLGFSMTPQFMLTPYLTVGYHKWERNAGDGAPGSYNETYQNGYYGVGLLGQYSPVQRLVLSGRAMIGHTDGARIDSLLLSQDLGGSGLYQLGLGADYAITSALHANVRAVYTVWNYAASAVTTYGLQGLMEPDSRTADATLKVGLAYGF